METNTRAGGREDRSSDRSAGKDSGSPAGNQAGALSGSGVEKQSAVSGSLLPQSPASAA